VGAQSGFIDAREALPAITGARAVTTLQRRRQRKPVASVSAKSVEASRSAETRTAGPASDLCGACGTGVVPDQSTRGKAGGICVMTRQDQRERPEGRT